MAIITKIPDVHPEGRIRSPRIALMSVLFPVPLGEATAMQTSGSFAYVIEGLTKYKLSIEKESIYLFLDCTHLGRPSVLPSSF